MVEAKYLKLIKFPILFVWLMFLTSCEEENSTSHTELESIRKESQLKIGPEIVKIGKRTECYDVDCITTAVYQVPSMKNLEFLNKIKLDGDSLSKWGYWRKRDQYLYYEPDPRKLEKGIYITMEYSLLSRILIVNWYDI